MHALFRANFQTTALACDSTVRARPSHVSTFHRPFFATIFPRWGRRRGRTRFDFADYFRPTEILGNRAFTDANSLPFPSLPLPDPLDGSHERGRSYRVHSRKLDSIEVCLHLVPRPLFRYIVRNFDLARMKRRVT